MLERLRPTVDRRSRTIGHAHSDERHPGDHLLVRSALHALVDDLGDGAQVAATPRPLGETAEQQAVEPPIVQPERVRPHDLEAISGALNVATVGIEEGGDDKLHDPVETLRVEIGEQFVGLGPPSELVAIPRRDGVEHAGEHWHRRRSSPSLACSIVVATNSSACPSATTRRQKMSVDADGVGDVAAAHGELECVVQLGQSALEVPHLGHGHAERVSGVPLVARRSRLDGCGDRFRRPLDSVVRPVDSFQGVGVGGQARELGPPSPAMTGTRRMACS